MPSQITHILILERALESISRLKKYKFDKHKIFLNFGAQGPDIFYHNQRTMPSGLHYGVLLHKKSCGSFVANLAGQILEKGMKINSPEAAYIIGLASHGHTDTVIHPYIVYKAGWHKPRQKESFRFYHSFLERILDTELLNSWCKINVRNFDLESQIGNFKGMDVDNFDKSISFFIERALSSVYKISTARDTRLRERICNAIKDTRNFFSFTNPIKIITQYKQRPNKEINIEERRFKSILYPQGIEDLLDFSNISCKPWKHPLDDGRIFTSSFFDLTDIAVKKSCLAISALLDFWQTSKNTEADKKDLASIIGDGGLNVSNVQGLASAPKINEVLELGKILDNLEVITK